MTRTTNEYWQWIAAHQPTNPRGQCVTVTLAMAEAFPALRRVRGHYTCPLDGRRSHWWLVTTDGQIVDPTQDQFQSNGVGDYEEYEGPEPTGQCLDCGALLFGASYFCNDICAQACLEFMGAGGSIYVNGKQVSP